MSETSTIAKINEMLKKISNLLSTHDLSEIPSLTYKMRENGEDMIYFSKGTWNETTKYLVPAPLKKQREYYEFFALVADECKSLPKYTVYITENEIKFSEKGKLGIDGVSISVLKIV